MTWGGARNHFVSHALTAKRVQEIYDTAYAAIDVGRPLNRFVTVHWTALGVPDKVVARATGKLMKLAADWCATKGVKIAWAWVRENDAGDMSKGSHVHILLHCPTDLAIGRMWRRWLRRIGIGKYRAGALASRSIGPRLNTCVTNQALYRSNLDVVLAYACKGVDPNQGGKIIGKRSGASQNLCAVAHDPTGAKK